MKDTMTLSLELESELLTSVRLTTGGLCSLAGLDIEDSEDFKVCVTESLLIMKRNGYSSAKIAFRIEDGLSAYITGEEESDEVLSGEDDEISYALLEALVECFRLDREGDRVHAISFRFGS